MSIKFEDKINFLKNQKVFSQILEEDLNKIARRMTVSSYKVNDVLYSQGSNGRCIFFIFSGEVILWKSEGNEKKRVLNLMPFDELGINAILNKRPHQNTSTVSKDSLIIEMNANNFEWLLKTYPQVKINIFALAKAKKHAQKLNFDWLQQGEVIFMITRRHPAELLIDLLKPISTLMLSGLFLLVTRYIPGLIALSTVIGTILATLSLGWIIWQAFDWQNDYFIITNERIVWIEEVIFQRSSRQEIPLPQIQFVNVNRSYWGRLLNFGDVTIRTYTHTGNLRLDFVRDPITFQSLIDQQLIRSDAKEEELKSEALRQTVRQSLGLENGEEFIDISNAALENDQQPTRLLKTRIVSQGEITYYKHWMVLVKTTWWQFLGLAGIGGVILLKLFNLTVSTLLPSLQTTLIFSFLLAFGLIMIIWYHFSDYRNDLYRLTSDMIVDLEKKPFGQEDSKTAPLKNIQSIRIERNGIIQVFFNYGSVHVNVADDVLDFVYIHDPAQVQRDIFYQKRQLEISEDKMDTSREHERISDYLDMYRDVWKKEDDLHNNDDE